MQLIDVAESEKGRPPLCPKSIGQACLLPTVLLNRQNERNQRCLTIRQLTKDGNRLKVAVIRLKSYTSRGQQWTRTL